MCTIRRWFRTGVQLENGTQMRTISKKGRNRPENRLFKGDFEEQKTWAAEGAAGVVVKAVNLLAERAPADPV